MTAFLIPRPNYMNNWKKEKKIGKEKGAVLSGKVNMYFYENVQIVLKSSLLIKDSVTG